MCLKSFEHDSLLLLPEFEFRHVEEMGKDIAVIDEEVLLDRSEGAERG